MLKDTIRYKKLNPKAQVPTYGTEFSAGADLYACLDEAITIEPGQTILVKTGIAMEIPAGYGGMIFARSGLATKKGLAPANKVGVVDSDYRGEVMVGLYNHSQVSAIVEPGERIAQMVILPFLAAQYVEVEELQETRRGEGGFGSTGKK